MFGLGATELIIILVLVLIFFGAGRLPGVGKALGGGIRNFKRSVTGADEATPDDPPEPAVADDDSPAPPPQITSD